MLHPPKTAISILVGVMALAILVSASACSFDAPKDTEPSSRAQLPTPETADIIVVDDKIPPDLIEPDAVAAFQTGYNEMLARRWYSAIIAYDEAARLQPNSDAVYGSRGTAHRYAGNHDEAIADYTKAIELDPQEASYWRLRAHTYSIGPSPEPDKSVSDATKAIDLDPAHHMGYGHRAIALTMLPTPDWHGALADLDRSIERHPRHDSGAYEFRAWINDQLGDHAQAEQDRQMAR